MILKIRYRGDWHYFDGLNAISTETIDGLSIEEFNKIILNYDSPYILADPWKPTTKLNIIESIDESNDFNIIFSDTGYILNNQGEEIGVFGPGACWEVEERD